MRRRILWTPGGQLRAREQGGECGREREREGFQALHCLQESRAGDEQVEIGARPSPEEHEVLLSEDLPSPPQSSD